MAVSATITASDTATAATAFGLVSMGGTARGHGWTITADFEGGNGRQVAQTITQMGDPLLATRL